MMEEYIVQSGDTLSIIAAKKLNDKNRWSEIAQLNKLQNPNKLLVGQLLKLPNARVNAQPSVVLNQSINILPDSSSQQFPASIIPARGFIFVVFEQLPDVGSKNVIRKVAVIPKDFSLSPPNPLANLTSAQHALGNNNSQFLSGSDKPFGSPTMAKASPTNPNGWKELLLIDTLKTAAVQAQKTLLINSDTMLSKRFATKFFPANQTNDKKNQFKMIWENSPAIDKNKNKILDSEEWKDIQRKKHFCHLI